MKSSSTINEVPFHVQFGAQKPDRTLPGITENISVPLWPSFRLTYTSFGTNPQP
ncbi:hypothetical protein Tsp_11927, partial [Trichinella spiralis]|uniref:hypothetical protein n=1 Tax=Trichinella spiralis TaxID=6334 RepID=UPI0001EFD203